MASPAVAFPPEPPCDNSREEPWTPEQARSVARFFIILKGIRDRIESESSIDAKQAKEVRA